MLKLVNQNDTQVGSSSTPNLNQMNPNDVEWQMKVVDMIRSEFDYTDSIHEILLSGSIGSAKSLLMAHLAVTHCLAYSDANFLIGRQAMPRLKDTILKKVLDHLKGALKKNVHYTHNIQSGNIKFWNGAEITCISWADKDYQKFRSYEFSAGAIEELTENDSVECEAFHTEMIGRIGRINPDNSNVKETFVVYATNPDDPSHWAYDYFIKGTKPVPNFDYVRSKGNIHVVYSLTKHNKFLPKSYQARLEEIFDAKMILRMLKGQWIYIKTERIYYEYDSDIHYGFTTTPHKQLPLRFSFDFNIGAGKPMSSIVSTYNIGQKLFVFHDEVVVEGARTLDVMDEWQGKGWFDLEHNPKIIIHGDASGRHNDTRSKQSDYELIEGYLSNYIRRDGARIEFEIAVPLANPPIRDRHNLSNGQLRDSNGKIHVQIDERCVTLDEGLRKDKLKVGKNGISATYMEDDSKHYQHICTAFGYEIVQVIEDGEELPPIQAA